MSEPKKYGYWEEWVKGDTYPTQMDFVRNIVGHRKPWTPNEISTAVARFCDQLPTQYPYAFKRCYRKEWVKPDLLAITTGIYEELMTQLPKEVIFKRTNHHMQWSIFRPIIIATNWYGLPTELPMRIVVVVYNCKGDEKVGMNYDRYISEDAHFYMMWETIHGLLEPFGVNEANKTDYEHIAEDLKKKIALEDPDFRFWNTLAIKPERMLDDFDKIENYPFRIKRGWDLQSVEFMEWADMSGSTMPLQE